MKTAIKAMINPHQGKFARRSVIRVCTSAVGSLGAAGAVVGCWELILITLLYGTSEIDFPIEGVKTENLTMIESVG
jgi:hypothetical protein